MAFERHPVRPVHDIRATNKKGFQINIRLEVLKKVEIVFEMDPCMNELPAPFFVHKCFVAHRNSSYLGGKAVDGCGKNGIFKKGIDRKHVDIVRIQQIVDDPRISSLAVCFFSNHGVHYIFVAACMRFNALFQVMDMPGTYLNVGRKRHPIFTLDYLFPNRVNRTRVTVFIRTSDPAYRIDLVRFFRRGVSGKTLVAFDSPVPFFSDVSMVHDFEL